MRIVLVGRRVQIERAALGQPRQFQRRAVLAMQIAGQRRGERRLVQREGSAGRQGRLVPASDRVLSGRGGEGNENANAEAPGRDNANRPNRIRPTTHAHSPTLTPRHAPGVPRETRSSRGTDTFCLSRIRLAGLLPAAAPARSRMAQGAQSPITCSATSRRCGLRRCSTRNTPCQTPSMSAPPMIGIESCVCVSAARICAGMSSGPSLSCA